VAAWTKILVSGWLGRERPERAPKRRAYSRLSTNNIATATF
jgi:hypothetical protein